MTTMDSMSAKRKPGASNKSGQNTQPSKRKLPQDHAQPSNKRRRVQAQDARVIAAQTSGKAFGDGEIDVDKFVRAREFEIRALEDGMRRAKKILSTRAFQNVPREMRRRTASHNVKRVPKRLRARAGKEMAEDNTPTVNSKTRKSSSRTRLRLEVAKRLRKLGAKPSFKASDEAEIAKSAETVPTRKEKKVTTRTPRIKKNILKTPPRPKARFRKRQIHKSWLPTHLFHAKRAHMTSPKEPLWRMSIPLSPTQKSYRPTHRASSLRGAVAWDTSYMSTIGVYGLEASIISLLQELGVGVVQGERFWDIVHSKWIRGTRTWQGWIYEPNSQPLKSMAPVTVIWATRSIDDAKRWQDQITKSTNQIKRVTRAIFIRVHPAAFLQVWHEVLRLSKLQRPALNVEDLRFEIGSIELHGPASTEALVGALWPIQHQDSSEKGEHGDTTGIWPLLKNVSSPAHLPAGALLGMDISDPRLHHPARKNPPLTDPSTQQRLIQTLASWPLDNVQSAHKIFSRASRFAASRRLPSQKAINRRKALAAPGTYPEAKESDPEIPMLVFTSQQHAESAGGWVVLLPWKCVLPVWYSLMYFPLSSGANPRFGGLNQKRQVLFENGVPWFPGDFPGTKAGDAWEAKEREVRKAEWEKKPKGKRVEWESVDLGKGRKGEVGLGWACDWNRLVNASDGTNDRPVQFLRTPSSIAMERLKARSTSQTSDGGSHALIQVKVTLLCRGVPAACGRVYRLPSQDQQLRQQWLSLHPAESHAKNRDQQPRRPKVAPGAPAHVRRGQLAMSILDPVAVVEKDYPVVPDVEDLIGYITTGSFNLGEGKGTGIGSILLEKVVEQASANEGNRRERHLCIVREAGLGHGRLARWEFA